jgi:2'-5' RNA ligase
MSEREPARRLFFALWPPEAVQRELARRARQTLAGRGKVPPTANIHLTLAFAGEVDGATEACLREQAASLNVPAFRLTLDRLGYWPRKRLLWAAPAEPPQALIQLGEQLQAGLPACGLSAPHRHFTPHITLARKAPRQPEAQAMDEPPGWEVTRFVLVASRLGAAGAEYTIVGEWPLTGNDANSAGDAPH